MRANDALAAASFAGNDDGTGRDGTADRFRAVPVMPFASPGPSRWRMTRRACASLDTGRPTAQPAIRARPPRTRPAAFRRGPGGGAEKLQAAWRKPPMAGSAGAMSQEARPAILSSSSVFTEPFAIARRQAPDPLRRAEPVRELEGQALRPAKWRGGAGGARRASPARRRPKAVRSELVVSRIFCKMAFIAGGGDAPGDRSAGAMGRPTRRRLPAFEGEKPPPIWPCGAHTTLDVARDRAADAGPAREARMRACPR